MASYPPPPPPPQMDPRWQRHYVREQVRAQKAAWKAQRDQFRYQSRSLRRGSVLGPILLIGLGLIFLLLQTGHIDAAWFWDSYARWWPLLLVGAGLVILAEWALDQFQMRNPDRPQYRRSIGGGVIVLLLFIVFTGMAASGIHSREHWMFRGFHMDPDTLDTFLGDKHESDQTLDFAFPAGAQLNVVNPRGDVTISGTSDDGKIHIAVHKQVYTRSDSEAENRAQQLSPRVEPASGSGGTFAIDLPSLEGARADLVITAPADAPTTVTSNRGDVHIGSVKSAVAVTANHGDIELNGITGQATAHINNGGASLSAHSIDGGLAIKGHADDLTLADVRGPVTIEGEFFGTTHLEHINGTIHFHTSRADFQMARLDGSAEIEHDSDISADQAMGPLVLTTHNGNVSLDRIAGDIAVTNRNGAIDLTAAPSLGNITLEDRNGTIKATLPESAGFAVQAATTNGNVNSDFALNSVASDSGRTLSGNVGSGGPMVRITTTNGDIALRKAVVAPLPPAPPAPPKITMQPTDTPSKGARVPKPPAPPAPPTPAP